MDVETLVLLDLCLIAVLKIVADSYQTNEAVDNEITVSDHRFPKMTVLLDGLNGLGRLS